MQKARSIGRASPAFCFSAYCRLPTAYYSFHWLTPRSAITKAGPSLLSTSCSKVRLPIQLRKASSRNPETRRGGEYSAVNARQSLHDLYASGRVASARVEVDENSGRRSFSADSSSLRGSKTIVIAGVTIRIGPTTGTPVARDEIRARLNLLEPGRRFSIPAIEKNADEIQTYMRRIAVITKPRSNITRYPIPETRRERGALWCTPSRRVTRLTLANSASQSGISIRRLFDLRLSCKLARRSPAIYWATI